MEGVISLGVGEPDFVTPWAIREAAIHAIERGRTTYTANAGLLELRQRIAEYVQSTFGPRYDPETEILVTVGVSQGLDLALRALLVPGDEVLIPEPCYVSYVPCVAMTGARPVLVPTVWQDDFQIIPERLEALVSENTKALIVCSPGNPTGAVQTREVLEAIVAIAERHDLYILSDEIYAELSYDGPHCCVAALPDARDRTILLNGLSKSHAMTGWRVGYVCAPRPVAAAMLKIHQYTALCASHISQAAALEALSNGAPITEEMAKEYNRRRKFFVNALEEAGLPCPMPGGAFYAFPFVAHLGLDAETFAERLLLEEGVAVVPGGVFGPSGSGHVRCSYAASFAVLEQAVERIRRFVGRLRPANAPMTRSRRHAGSLAGPVRRKR